MNATHSQKTENDSTYSLTGEEIVRLLDATSSYRDRDYIIIRILAYSGIRRSELRSLEVGDIDFSRQRLYVRLGKGNKPRIVPLDSTTLETIETYVKRYDLQLTDLIFSNKSPSISANR